MANIIVIGLTDRNSKKGLRSPCEGVNLDYLPPDDSFKVNLYTEDTGSYPVTSTRKFLINGALVNTITMAGRADLSLEVMYDPSRSFWVVTDHNLNQGTGGTGPGEPGEPGVTPNITLTAHALPAGSQPTVEKSGTLEAPVFDIGVPAGPRGLPGAGDGTGTGGVFRPEVELIQDANGAVTPDGSLSNSFRVLPTKKLIINNPINFTESEDFRITIRQPLTGGPIDAEWGLAYGHPDRQLPKLATKPGGVNKAVMTFTDAMGPEHPELWETDVLPRDVNGKASAIGYGAPSIIARNVQRGTEYYVLRSPTLLGGMTDIRDGETLKIVRDGLGVEAYGAFESGNVLLSGALPNGNRAELRTGDGVRSAFDRAVIAVAGTANATIQDLIVSGAREQSGGSHIAAGVNLAGAANAVLKNMLIMDNENGVTAGNEDFTGSLKLEDVELRANGVGDDGLTHNMYTGRHNQAVELLRVYSNNCVVGHNLKHRDGAVIHRQVRTFGAKRGRELNLPNGTNGLFEDCHYWKSYDTTQGNLIAIAEEGVAEGRVHAYVWRNVHFQNDVSGGGKDVTFVINFDRVVMYFIDCLFTGDQAKALNGDPNGQYPGMVTAAGIRYWPEVPPVFQFTGGPLGPRPGKEPGNAVRSVIQIA